MLLSSFDKHLYRQNAIAVKKIVNTLQIEPELKKKKASDISICLEQKYLWKECQLPKKK